MICANSAPPSTRRVLIGVVTPSTVAEERVLSACCVGMMIVSVELGWSSGSKLKVMVEVFEF